MRLAVGVISNRDWSPHFGVSIVNLYGHLMNQGVCGKPLESIGFFPYLWCSNICQARAVVIRRAKEMECSHLLFVDDDMVFPPDLMDTLGKHADKDVIGCNYHNKTQPRPTTVGLDWNHLPSKGKTGIEEVNAVGFGAVLLKLDVVDCIPEPWFQHEWIERLQTTTTDDTYFCLLAKEHGKKIYVDHDASQNIKHLGKQELPTL